MVMLFRHKVLGCALILLIFCGLPSLVWGHCDKGVSFQRVMLTEQELQDDLDGASLLLALSKSHAYFQGLSGLRELTIAGEKITLAKLERSLADLARYLENGGMKGLAGYLYRHFDFYQTKKTMLVTGYYEPVLAGRLQPTATFHYPLYRVPPKNKQGLSRQEIVQHKGLAGYELVYLASPVDSFFVHVQGSALIVLADGSRRRLHYAADNGWPYRSIGKMLIDQGKISKGEMSLLAIKQYLLSHPLEQQQIFNYNQRYIFFSLSMPLPAASAGGPPGALGQNLVAGRSVALDSGCYPPGGLGLLRCSLPSSAGQKKIQRLVLSHDRGAAIKGQNRLDFFVGQGEIAQRLAGPMQEKGEFFILLPK